jgi:hypothetical protein
MGTCNANFFYHTLVLWVIETQGGFITHANAHYLFYLPCIWEQLSPNCSYICLDVGTSWVILGFIFLSFKICTIIIVATCDN